MHRNDSTLALLLLALTPAAQQGDSTLHPSFDQGVYPTVYPQPGDVLLEDFPVHTDEVGGTEQGLVDLRGAPGGTVGLWTDLRDGNLGLYVGLLDEQGESVRPEARVHPPVTARQLDPTLALGPELRGGVSWFLNRGQQGGIHARFFDANGFTSAQALSVGELQRGSGRSPGVRPAIVLTPDGGALVARVDAGRLLLNRFEARGRRMALTAEPSVISTAKLGATGAPALACAEGGEVLCAWSGPGGIATWVRGADGVSGPTRVASGEVSKALVASDGGWWIQAKDEAGHCLLRLEQDGRLRGEPVRLPDRDVRAMDSTGLAGGLAVLAERNEVSAQGQEHGWRTELYFLDADGALQRNMRVDGLFGDEARAVAGSRIASTGVDAKELLLAWTDRRNGDADVFYRRITFDEISPVAQKWNTDEFSSDQSDGEVDSNGRQAVVVWEDRRFGGLSQIFTRLIGASGPLAARDSQLGTRPGDDAQPDRSRLPDSRVPTVAMAQNGDYLVVFKLKRGRGYEVVAQLLHSGGSAKTELLQVDPGQTSSVSWAPAVAALANDGGFVVTWIRQGVGPMARRLRPDGTAQGEPSPLTTRSQSSAMRPAITALDDGRAFVAWDQAAGQGHRGILGRFLGANGQPEGAPISIPPTTLGSGDLDPSLAPGPDGGFVLAWTGNEAPARDALARVFDRRGRPVTPILWVSVKKNEQDYTDVTRLADGTWAIAWEDDISGQDHVCLRRLDPSGWRLGPQVTLNQRETQFNEARTGGLVAPLGDGLVGVWRDRRRSKGGDIFARILGPGFDTRP